MSFKSFFGIASASLSCMVLSTALANDFPNKPITMVVPYPPGGPSDNLGRVLAASMGKILQQTVVIDNTSGAGGTIGTAKIVRSAKDGYWILLHNIGISTAPALYRSLPYKADDLAPIGLIASAPSVIIARKDLPANNLAELQAYMKKENAKVQYGHAGVGSASQLCSLLLHSTAKAQVLAISYKGAAPAMADLLSGHFDYMCEQTSVALPYIESGRVKAIATTSKKRLPQLPNVPTSAEGGMPTVDIGVWHGLYAPAGTPKDVVEKLSDALAKALRDPVVQKRYAELGVEIYSSEDAKPGPLARLQQAETTRWAPIIKEAAVYAD